MTNHIRGVLLAGCLAASCLLSGCGNEDIPPVDHTVGSIIAEKYVIVKIYSNSSMYAVDKNTRHGYEVKWKDGGYRITPCKDCIDMRVKNEPTYYKQKAESPLL